MSMADDQVRFSYAHINVNPVTLLRQNGGENLTLIKDSVHVMHIKDHLDGVDFTVYETTHRVKLGTTDGDVDKFNTLVDDMKTNGWLDGSRIHVVIDECGRVICVDGMHRSATAYCLGIEKIPVLILYRHTNWIRLKYLLKAINGGVRLYHPIEHPDLESWPSWR